MFSTGSRTRSSKIYEPWARNCKGASAFPTTLKFDSRLVNEAVRAGHHKTKKDAVTAALIEYIRYRKQLEILDWFGKVEYYDDYDYKKLRRRKPILDDL